MANKDVTFTEPTTSNITQIIIRYNAGVADTVEVGCDIEGDDGNASYQGNISTAASNFSSGVQSAFADLVTEAVQKIITEKGF